MCRQMDTGWPLLDYYCVQSTFLIESFLLLTSVELLATWLPPSGLFTVLGQCLYNSGTSVVLTSQSPSWYCLYMMNWHTATYSCFLLLNLQSSDQVAPMTRWLRPLFRFLLFPICNFATVRSVFNNNNYFNRKKKLTLFPIFLTTQGFFVCLH